MFIVGARAGVIPTITFSGSCPMKLANVDQALSVLDQSKHAAIIEAAKMLKISLPIAILAIPGPRLQKCSK